MAENPDPSALFFFVIEACSQGASSIINLFISATSDLEEPSMAGRSLKQLNCEYLMIESAANGHEKICLSLLPHCSFQAFTLYRGRPCGAVKRAAYEGHPAVVSALESAAPFSVTDWNTELQIPGLWTDFEAEMMINAARAGNVDVVAGLLTACAPQVSESMTTKFKEHELSDAMVQQRALMQATNGGHREVVIYLLDHGVPINSSVPWSIFDVDHDFSRDTLLTIARTVKLGCFALHLAIAQSDEAMVQLLLEGDADPDVGTYYFSQDGSVFRKSHSALAHAAALGNVKIERLLIDYEARPRNQDLTSFGLTNSRTQCKDPLIEAAGAGHVDMVEYLLSVGANPNYCDLEGTTPLSAASSVDSVDVIRVLMQKGARIT
ncbi:hypothetical protein B7463_g2205, partial [Scytalidium lignicola]